MRHFSYLSTDEKESIFFKQPETVLKSNPKELISYALGATLYMPANKPGISQDLISNKHEGLRSVVICLEDAISDRTLLNAEQLLIEEMQFLFNAIQRNEVFIEELPFIFIRVRSPEHLLSVAKRLDHRLGLLTGFVFPKFTYENGVEYLGNLNILNRTYHQHLYAMPILESSKIIYKESRYDELLKIKRLLDEHYADILNVRIGATDFSGLFGLRRSVDTTIYDISVIRDCISDIVNFFTRSEKEYVVSGPVWEYFSNGDRVFKPQLRRTPFEENYGDPGLAIRRDILNHYIDGLVQEVLLDQANGITGKTIIHPTHIKPVQSLYVVKYEEYMDARIIMENVEINNGVISSSFSNKMNEIKPHYNWAKKTILKSKVFGVYHEHQNFISILSERVHV